MSGLPVDSIGQLQAKILEVSDLMLNAFGLAQRDAPPVRFSSTNGAETPLCVPAENQEAWMQQCQAQKQQRAEHAKQLVAACLDIDRLAQTLPERRDPDVAQLLKLQEELKEAEEAVNQALSRSQKVFLFCFFFFCCSLKNNRGL